MSTSQDIIYQRSIEVTFITEQDVKVKTPLSANKVTTSIINYIMLSQDMHIKKVLGSTLFDKLMAEWIVANYDPTFLPVGDGVITPIIVGDTINYNALYFEIRKPLIWWSYVLALPTIAIKVEEAGIMLNSTDYSESSGMVGLDRLVAEGSMIARSYTEQLQEYMCDTFSDDVDVNTESKDVGGVSIGIFFPSNKFYNDDKCCR